MLCRSVSLLAALLVSRSIGLSVGLCDGLLVCRCARRSPLVALSVDLSPGLSLIIDRSVALSVRCFAGRSLCWLSVDLLVALSVDLPINLCRLVDQSVSLSVAPSVSALVGLSVGLSVHWLLPSSVGLVSVIGCACRSVSPSVVVLVSLKRLVFPSVSTVIDCSVGRVSRSGSRLGSLSVWSLRRSLSVDLPFALLVGFDSC